MTEYLANYDSPLGNITMIGDGHSLTAIQLAPRRSDSDTLPVFDETRRWLDVYFSGREPDFMPSIHLRGTPFQLKVWQQLQTIPYATTVSYGDLARRLSIRSAQAVGGAVGSNPIAIIVPCHRVIGASGALVGYAYGLDCKRYLLELEAGLKKTDN